MQIAAERQNRTEVKDQAETMDRRLSVSSVMNRRQSFTGAGSGNSFESKMPRRSSIMVDALPPQPENDELKRIKDALDAANKQIADLKGEGGAVAVAVAV